VRESSHTGMNNGLIWRAGEYTRYITLITFK